MMGLLLEQPGKMGEEEEEDNGDDEVDDDAVEGGHRVCEKRT